MDMTAYIDIPIMVIVYFLVEGIKRFIIKEDDKKRSLLPVIAALLGSIVSILVYLYWPSVTTSFNVLNAFASGAVSGTAATGSNQIYKQLMKFFTPDNS